MVVSVEMSSEVLVVVVVVDGAEEEGVVLFSSERFWEGSALPFQLAPTSHHFPRLEVLRMSVRLMRRGSLALMLRVFRVPRERFMRVRCSEVMAEVAAPALSLLFLRSFMVSIMNFVRTERLASLPLAETVFWRSRTMSLREEGSSWRSWEPDAV